MIIVDLGTFTLNVGDNPTMYTPFSFVQSQGYGVGAIFTTPNFSNILSFVRVRPRFIVPGQPPVFSADAYDLEVFPGIQLMLIPASTLYRGDGTIELFADRRSFWTGGGDGTPLSMQLLYDDDLSTPTWR